MKNTKFRAYVELADNIKFMVSDVTVYPEGRIGFHSDILTKNLPEHYSLDFDGEIRCREYIDGNYYFKKICNIELGDDWVVLDDNQFELMQFTNSSDEKQQELYEEDIFRTFNYCDTKNKPIYTYHKIVYDVKYNAFCAINLNNSNELLTTNGNGFLYVFLKSLTIEKIGNKFENPELLETNK